MQFVSRASWPAGFIRWGKLLFILLADNIPRRKRFQWGAILAIAEPFGLIGLFWLHHHFVAGQRPLFGNSALLFLTTGVLPYYLFLRIARRLRNWDVLPRWPRTTEFDLMLVHVTAELFVICSAVAICCFGFWLADVEEWFPRDVALCLRALLVIAVLGIGTGFLNATIGGFFPIWRPISSIAMRVWLLFSGVREVVDWMPLQLRDFVELNPLSHAISWYRTGYYTDYPSITLDVEYLLLWTLGLVSFGWLVMHSTRRWRSA